MNDLFNDFDTAGVEWDIDTLMTGASSQSAQHEPNSDGDDDEDCSTQCSIRDCVLLTRGCKRGDNSPLVEQLQELLQTCHRNSDHATQSTGHGKRRRFERDDAPTEELSLVCREETIPAKKLCKAFDVQHNRLNSRDSHMGLVLCS